MVMKNVVRTNTQNKSFKLSFQVQFVGQSVKAEHYRQTELGIAKVMMSN